MRTSLLLLIPVVLITCSQDNMKQEKAIASKALKPFKMELMHTLQKTMQEEGPLAAIRVCSMEAPEIARQNERPGILMGRTSHKLRNPDNEPREWVKPLLAHYVSMPEDTSSRVVDLENNRTGYVEPIHVKALCLACHGDPPAAVATVIDSLYPADEATGFAESDFRGLFWVEMDRSIME